MFVFVFSVFTFWICPYYLADVVTLEGRACDFIGVRLYVGIDLIRCVLCVFLIILPQTVLAPRGSYFTVCLRMYF